MTQLKLDMTTNLTTYITCGKTLPLLYKNSTDFGYFYGKFRNYSKITGVLKSKCRDTLRLEFFTCEIVNLTKFDKNVQILTK